MNELKKIFEKRKKKLGLRPHAELLIGLIKYLEKTFYKDKFISEIEQAKTAFRNSNIDELEDIYIATKHKLMKIVLEQMHELILKNFEDSNRLLGYLNSKEYDTLARIIYTEFINTKKWKPTKIEDEILFQFSRLYTENK